MTNAFLGAFRACEGTEGAAILPRFAPRRSPLVYTWRRGFDIF